MELEQALDELYAAAPEEFVAERKRLAKELKADGRDADADHLSKLRKPVVAAWALNRLARDHRRDIDLLLDTGHRLRQAQAGVLRGDAREAFEQAQRTERDAIGRLVREAERLLGERGGASASVLEQISASLHAAAVSEQRTGDPRSGAVHRAARAGGLRCGRRSCTAAVQAAGEAEAVTQRRRAETRAGRARRCAQAAP